MCSSFLLLFLCPAVLAVSNVTAKDILNEMSWGLKMKVLNGLYADPTSTQSLQSHISPGLPRKVGVERLQQSRRADDVEVDENMQESMDIRLKLSRLMYETMRDNIVKVKRAALIIDYYRNMPPFEIGCLMGDIYDKNEFIENTDNNMVRFMDEWRPLEFVNAYEQITMKAIEISFLINMVLIADGKLSGNGSEVDSGIGRGNVDNVNGSNIDLNGV